ncbi:MAG: pirin family protein [Xanthomonadaceae bacterium]|nr:pirin family protein [Xanthomonadaceae bacterium]
MSREVDHIFTAQPTEDGAGVKLRRVFSSTHYPFTNPFIMMDEFGSDDASDYIAGFPAHPHKGFDTITFMLNGKMTHQDSTGGEGTISDMEVQWMQTGRGIIHSEMPAQTEGKMRGMQIWLNVPKTKKVAEPAYHGFKARETVTENGNTLHVIGGDYNGTETELRPPATDPHIYYLIFNDAMGDHFIFEESRTVLIYLLKGQAKIGNMILKEGQVAALDHTSDLVMMNAELGSEAMILSALPIDEPMIQYGPFVMNERHEINEAITAYQNGTFLD